MFGYSQPYLAQQQRYHQQVHSQMQQQQHQLQREQPHNAYSLSATTSTITTASGSRQNYHVHNHSYNHNHSQSVNDNLHSINNNFNYSALTPYPSPVISVPDSPFPGLPQLSMNMPGRRRVHRSHHKHKQNHPPHITNQFNQSSNQNRERDRERDRYRSRRSHLRISTSNLNSANILNTATDARTASTVLTSLLDERSEISDGCDDFDDKVGDISSISPFMVNVNVICETTGQSRQNQLFLWPSTSCRLLAELLLDGAMVPANRVIAISRKTCTREVLLAEVHPNLCGLFDDRTLVDFGFDFTSDFLTIVVRREVINV